MPNIGQIVMKLPAQMNHAHPATISTVEVIEPASSRAARMGCRRGRALPATETARRGVPASIVVRMNSASNMMAKWYQIVEHAAACPAALRRSAPCRPPASRRRRSARFRCADGSFGARPAIRH